MYNHVRFVRGIVRSGIRNRLPIHLYTASTYSIKIAPTYNRISHVSLSTLPPRLQATIEDNLLLYIRQLSWSSIINSSTTTVSNLSPKQISNSTLGDLGIIKSVEVQSIPNPSSSSHNPKLRITIKLALPFPSSDTSKKIIEPLPTILPPKLITLDSIRSLGLSISDIEIISTIVPYIHHQENIAKSGKGLTNVGSIIAVSSCKGGVGKSTVAVNLTFALAQLIQNNSIGLLDTDIYGPSLPTMVQPLSLTVKQNEEHGTISPLYVPSSSSSSTTTATNPVACMSYGWVSRRNERGERGGAVMRGPMVSQVVSQLLRLTEWGNLQHLVLDMPPGTGDIPITIGQTIPITGAIIVTTPQKLAIVDVRKGLDMFKSLKVSPLAIILNMTHFDAPDTGKRYYPFGTDGINQVKQIMKDYGIPENRLFTLPLDSALSTAGDNGIPEVVANPNSSLSKIYKEIATAITNDVEQRILNPRIMSLTTDNKSIKTEGLSSSTNVLKVAVKYDDIKKQINVRSINENGAWDTYISSATIRRACKCAACVDEMTGKQRLQPETVPETIIPTNISEAGNYGVSITWSDGHSSSIYTYDQLLSLVNKNK